MLRTGKSELVENGLPVNKGVVISEAACFQDVGGFVEVCRNMLCKMSIRADCDDLTTKFLVTF